MKSLLSFCILTATVAYFMLCTIHALVIWKKGGGGIVAEKPDG